MLSRAWAKANRYIINVVPLAQRFLMWQVALAAQYLARGLDPVVEKHRLQLVDDRTAADKV